MTILDKDIKLLWGAAAGRCSFPGCRLKLLSEYDNGSAVSLGAMAHIIAKSPSGARGSAGETSNKYENLILLCPTHHTIVDSKPVEYTVDKLRDFKHAHEDWVEKLLQPPLFITRDELFNYVRLYLMENGETWANFGPLSTTARSNPGSSNVSYWHLKRLETIIPNNSRIVNALESRTQFLDADQLVALAKFKVHASAYKSFTLFNEPETYPTFPTEMLTAYGIQ